MKQIRAGSRCYDLYYIEGVISTPKSETGSCYIRIKETGFPAKYTRAKICTLTNNITPDWCFIKDRNGRTHGFLLNEMQFFYVENDALIIVWSIAHGNKRGPVIAIKNISTSQYYFNNIQLRKMYSLEWLLPFGVSFSSTLALISNDWKYAFAIIISGCVAAFICRQHLVNLWTENFQKHFVFEHDYIK